MNSEETSLIIRRIMGQAVAEQARRFTYCLIYEESGESQVGTAVAVQLGTRFFLATAGHVIDNAHGIKVLIRDQASHYISDFVTRHCDNRLDVGLLEISYSNSHRFEFLSQDRLCVTIENGQEIPAMVVGYPGQFCEPLKQIDLTTESFLRVVQCNTLTFHTVVLPQSEWPCEGLPDVYGNYRQLDNVHDMLIDFTPYPKVRRITPKTAGNDNPAIECLTLDPRGMSGGGIWLAQITQTNERIQAPDPRFIGLQVGWHRSRNLLRSIRIGAWLDLVRDQYPNLMTEER